MLLQFGRRGPLRRVEWDKLLFHRLGQYGADNPMLFHNGLADNPPPVFLLPRLRQLCIQAVQMVGPEVLQR